MKHGIYLPRVATDRVNPTGGRRVGLHRVGYCSGHDRLDRDFLAVFIPPDCSALGFTAFCSPRARAIERIGSLVSVAMVLSHFDRAATLRGLHHTAVSVHRAAVRA